MRIGIDARELCGRPTGVGRYLGGLLREWTAGAAGGRHSFVLYAHQNPSVSLPAGATLRVVPGRPGSGGTAWEQLSLPAAARRDRLDVFFAPGYSAPLLLRTPTVLVVHDLSFVRQPEWFHFREGLRRSILTHWSSRRARVVLTDSEFVRGEIIARWNLPPGRVRCVRPGVERLQALHPIQIRREPLVLFVGSIFNRRRVPHLIRAFKLVVDDHPDVRLEIVGDNRTHPVQDLGSIVTAEGLEKHVAVRSYVSDEALADLYSRASAFAFLSEYEGFGFPPLEALGCGVPGVLLDTKVARETCGDAALYVGHDDLHAAAAALTSLLFDPGVRDRILGRAPHVLARYSWSEAARQTLGALESAAGDRRG